MKRYIRFRIPYSLYNFLRAEYLARMSHEQLDHEKLHVPQIDFLRSIH